MSKVAVLFLAAGYGTRLQRDIQADTSGRFEAQKGVAKALLPLLGVPLISHWLKQLDQIQASHPTDSFVICNEFNHAQFVAWAEKEGFPKDSIFNDGTATNESRLGSTTDLSLAIKHFHLDNKQTYKGVLVIAGDTLFLKDFSLSEFITLSTTQRPNLQQPPCIVASYPVKHDIDTLKTGIIETDSHDSFGTALRVTSLIEKPHPTATKSRLACPCFYYFSYEALGKIHEFVDGSIARGEGLEARDAAGRLIEWLVLRYPVYTTGISGRLDIGGLDSYIEAEEYLKSA
ncbi:hypothetical protein HDU79_001234 [Rhizoclosmatium sp. JEL0117]|nr:hypothetical protein HDU79_001234 [Rhizoclosmatium sp. JEL0117]